MPRPGVTAEKYALFLSPHPDDLVWSSFSTLTGFSGRKVVVTLFNRSRRLGWGLKAPTPFVTFWRTVEDKVALSLLGAQTLHLYWPDTSVRGRTRFERPTRLERFEGAPAAIFSPLGVGGHLDHLYTRGLAVEAWFRFGRRPRLTFYEDLPYAAWMTSVEKREEEIVGELVKVCGELAVKHLPLTPTQMLRKILVSRLYASQDPPLGALVRRARLLGALTGAQYAERVVVLRSDA